MLGGMLPDEEENGEGDDGREAEGLPKIHKHQTRTGMEKTTVESAG